MTLKSWIFILSFLFIMAKANTSFSDSAHSGYSSDSEYLEVNRSRLPAAECYKNGGVTFPTYAKMFYASCVQNLKDGHELMGLTITESDLKSCTVFPDPDVTCYYVTGKYEPKLQDYTTGGGGVN